MSKTSTNRGTAKTGPSSPPKASASLKPPALAEVPLLTLDEVAQLDRTSVRTTRRAVAAELLEVLRVGPGGRLIRVTHEAYAAYRQRLRKGL